MNLQREKVHMSGKMKKISHKWGGYCHQVAKGRRINMGAYHLQTIMAYKMGKFIVCCGPSRNYSFKCDIWGEGGIGKTNLG